MKPKYCKDCSFVKIEMMSDGKHFQKMFLCGNINCSDPVDASPIPCGLARREVTLCGLHGKYYQEQPAQKEPEKGNVIQLEKV